MLCGNCFKQFKGNWPTDTLVSWTMWHVKLSLWVGDVREPLQQPFSTVIGQTHWWPRKVCFTLCNQHCGWGCCGTVSNICSYNDDWFWIPYRWVSTRNMYDYLVLYQYKLGLIIECQSNLNERFVWEWLIQPQNTHSSMLICLQLACTQSMGKSYNHPSVQVNNDLSSLIILTYVNITGMEQQTC